MLAFGALLLATPWLVRGGVRLYYDRKLYVVEQAPARPVAIVFGAAVYGGDRLSTVLRDRVDAAVDLYLSGRVEQIIVTGHASSEYYDEPRAMKAYAVERGVPAEAILTDGEGHRTYDSCYRARNVYGVESAVLVTQAFHLPRALLTCRWLGIEAVGAVADQRPYRGARWYEMRETGATLVAIWDVLRNEPPPPWDGSLEQS